MKKFYLPLLLFVILISACQTSDKSEMLSEQNKVLEQKIEDLKKQVSKMRASDDRFMILAAKMDGIKATIKTNMGDIDLKFFTGKAPLQTFNFITRAECGYYDGTQFHRVMPGFMIQGGDPHTKTSNKALYGQGGPIVSIPHEFNEVKHKRGILSTARKPNINAGAGSQFFIMHADNANLDGQYTVFGEVTKGMDVVDKIAAVKKNERNVPDSPVIVETIKVFR